METLKFYFVTWNVATRAPDQDLNSLLDFPSQFNKAKPLPDFYVIGLQEVKSQPQNMLMDTIFSDPWTASFKKILCRQGFILAKTIRLQGTLLLVYALMKHITHLRDIEAQYTKTGLGGMWGNKGAVSVRFNLYGCSFCLVNCHLTAHEHLQADRIQDFNTIVNQHVYHVNETINILYHDYVFWLGDLNFRTDHPTGSSPTSEEIHAMLQKVEKDVYIGLLKHDQLIAAIVSRDAFSDFREADIRFPPSYKFHIGTDEYDLKRKPSWTDRILVKVIPDGYENLILTAEPLVYNTVQHYTLSDHKPVVAMYNIKISSNLQPKRVVPRTAVRVTAFQPLSTTLDSSLTITQPRKASSDKTLANYTEKTVEFATINRIWYIGDAEFRTQCTLSADVVIHNNDWIGVFNADFESLDDYIAYEYLTKVALPEPSTENGQRTFTLSFPVGSGVRTPGFYRFIYFSQPSHDIKSVLGISEPFEASSKEDRVAAIDASQPAQGSSTEFTGLDVASLSRHFSNDLSID